MKKGRIVSIGSVEQVMTPENLNQVYDMDVYDWMRQMYGQWN